MAALENNRRAFARVCYHEPLSVGVVSAAVGEPWKRNEICIGRHMTAVTLDPRAAIVPEQRAEHGTTPLRREF